MSRLIVKHLPKNITEERIRQLFSEKGTVTDVQLKHTKEGKSRQFAFVGYKSASEAAAAIEQFDKSYLNTKRIKVELCADLGVLNSQKATTKFPKFQSPTKKNEELDLLTKYKDDELFEEFLKVNAPEVAEKLKTFVRETRPDNLDETKNEQTPDEEKGTEVEEEDEKNEIKEKIANKPISDADYLKLLKNKDSLSDENEKPKKEKTKKKPKNIKLFTLKMKGLPSKWKKKQIKDFFRPLITFNIRRSRFGVIAFVAFKTENNLKKAMLKDRSFIAGKQIFLSVATSKFDDHSTSTLDENPGNTKWNKQEESLKNVEPVAESGCIFFRNLSYITTESELEELFSKFGPLAQLDVPVDQDTKKVKGFGTVTFVMPENAAQAFSELDGTNFQGRQLHLMPGKSKNNNQNEENVEESTNYKKKKAAKQKSLAASGHNWNSLFLGPDAVANVVSDTWKVSKEQMLVADGSSAAVTLALGESHIVAETRKYLEQEGVVLDVFNSAPVKRSKTIILVKNLPSKTTVQEIKEMFEKHGTLGRVILPPSGITAVVEFLEPSEAKKAFLRVAYTKFKNVPLYLEYAPENILTEKNPTKTVQGSNDRVLKIEGESPLVEEEEEEAEPEENTTLYVKNLDFRTTDEHLRQHFEKCGKMSYAKVTINRINNLSRGYGFVRFIHKSSADEALKNLQQSVLDGKSLELKRSDRTLKNEVTSTRKKTQLVKQTGTKIMVKNIAFQATKTEIWNLFSPFGILKAVRLPQKTSRGSSGSHKGYGFVDFTLASDAKKAFDALSQSTHLYGRRLVLEWASEDEDVNALRKRTADHFKQTDEAKKSKKSVFSVE